MGRPELAIAMLCAVVMGGRGDLPSAIASPARAATAQPTAAPDPSAGVIYACPMDPDVRSYGPGTCKRCGMTLVAGIPDPVEFHVDLHAIPAIPQPGRASVLQFFVHDPWKDRPVADYNAVHERLFHAFVVSDDLQFFQHGHPVLIADGMFQWPVRFPKAGLYRVLSDFYPVGATPQLTTGTVFVGDGAQPAAPPHLGRDYSAKQDANINVALTTFPDTPTAGNRTQMRFTISPAHGLERYLGAWGHLLAASDDLIEMMHEHPFRTGDAGEIDFEVVLPRAATYRVWVQFQRQGIVNTVHFDVPVVNAPE